jgi:hypothetical protein
MASSEWRSNWKNQEAFRLSQMQFGVASSTSPIIDDFGLNKRNARWCRQQQSPAPSALTSRDTPRNLNDRTYTVVWLALSLDPIDRKHAST